MINNILLPPKKKTIALKSVCTSKVKILLPVWNDKIKSKRKEKYAYLVRKRIRVLVCYILLSHLNSEQNNYYFNLTPPFSSPPYSHILLCITFSEKRQREKKMKNKKRKKKQKQSIMSLNQYNFARSNNFIIIKNYRALKFKCFI